MGLAKTTRAGRGSGEGFIGIHDKAAFVRRFGHLKFFKKALARERTFDNLFAPFRLKRRADTALESGLAPPGRGTAVADR